MRVVPSLAAAEDIHFRARWIHTPAGAARAMAIGVGNLKFAIILIEHGVNHPAAHLEARFHQSTGGLTIYIVGGPIVQLVVGAASVGIR